MMTHLLAGDEKYRGLPYDDDYRSYLITQGNSPGEYRFGRTHGRRARFHVRIALTRFMGYLKNLIETIANSKMRRTERELQVQGIRSNRPGNGSMAHNPGRAGVRNT
jgi:hypothetical protein